MGAADARRAASALNRLGLGARDGDIAALGDAEAWAMRQSGQRADELDVFTGLPDSLDYLRKEAQLLQQRRALRRDGAGKPQPAQRDQDGKPVNPLARLYVQMFGAELRREARARWQIAARSDTPVAERLVRFWSNHFAVSVDKGPARLYAAPMEREAIRPHLNGRFYDMLIAVEQHPAMLRYLDQAQSVGPDSPLAERVDRRLARDRDGQPARKLGLNENLAREIMELHTLGVGAHYTQTDVTQFARALTGWSLPLPRELEQGDVRRAFKFRPFAHEPGSVSVLGKVYAQRGEDQAEAILADFAVHPATAKHLSTELARHFVSDTPPADLVDAMVRAYLGSGGDLTALYRAMLDHPATWAPQAHKIRTPQDLLYASLRAGAIDPGDTPRPWEGFLMRLGQPTFMPRSPAGYTDVAADWVAPDALWKRVQVAEAMAERVPRAGLDPHALAAGVLGTSLRGDTRTAIRRAEAPEQAVALLFASPEFQWRT
ncbi:MAG: DUF1800 domain-containing protein [Metallibacterium scheffleri]|jgi:uncharacterized protein (DUF1800 family)|uniref:DUF1800 domain-containing protein n=1 Tax=Metallibacterium scheffleri TaxID=993689 RepID=UPI0026EABD95|nr:DUF1800 domain-containing protein [Metallibacterium scheffleri]MCK9367718.1 DUF1800 domain-containing protein [Metallibacterium scheffleri]